MFSLQIEEIFSLSTMLNNKSKDNPNHSLGF